MRVHFREARALQQFSLGLVSMAGVLLVGAPGCGSPDATQNQDELQAKKCCHDPVTCLSSVKKALLRSVLSPQLTGGHWYPST